MKTNEIKLNPYKTTWAIITPNKGTFVTKHDIKAFGDIALFNRNKYHCMFFGSKHSAIDFFKNFRKKIDKKYQVRFITDKQAGMAKAGVNRELPNFPFTKKQLEEVLFIG